MRIKTLIATEDTKYTAHISEYISEHHADTIEVSVCNSGDQLSKSLCSKKYDVVLVDEMFVGEVNTENIYLPMVLDAGAQTVDAPAGWHRVRKYRRISQTIADVLETYAATANNSADHGDPVCTITAVWSPCGGVGKSAIALACCASCVTKAHTPREVFYLNLESFSASSVYFNEHSKSISTVFEMLEEKSGDVRMLIHAISNCEDGIRYLGAPDNFDDICILSPENISELLTYCAQATDELIVDLSSVCDANARRVFEKADKVILVTDNTDTSKAKLKQFISQGSVFESIKEKSVLVVNKTIPQNTSSPHIDSMPVISLPYIANGDTQFIYKTLAANISEQNI